MSITINETLRAYIDPLTENEYAALERSLLAEGCRDALVLWGEVLIDGHNRYAICRQHDIPFKTVQNDRFASIEDVQLWMIDNHLARRSVSDFQRGVLALRKKEIVAARTVVPDEGKAEAAEAETAAAPTVKPLQSRQEVARIAGISSNTISQIEKIQKTAAPELVQAVRAGTISINAAAAVASLPTAEQAAAVAGGRKELQQAARQVREQVRQTKSPAAKLQAASEATDESATTGADALHQKIAALTTENAALRQQVTALSAALEAAKAAG
jgi:transcriptional regulator with XRE-family HTH domain